MTKTKKVYCKTIDEFNYHLRVARRTSFAIFFERYSGNPIGQACFIEESSKYYKVTYKLNRKSGVVTYIFERNGETDTQTPELSDIRTSFTKSNKNKAYPKVKDYMPEIPYDHSTFKSNGQEKEIGYRATIGTASPIKSFNNKFLNKSTPAIEYDLRHAYGQFLIEDMPDISTCKRDARIKEGQVGFSTIGCTNEGFPRLRMVTKPGLRCDYVFDLVESPFKNWAIKVMTKLDRAETEEEKEKYKNYLRLMVGGFQIDNPFYRATIVEKCNQLIKSLIDPETTIAWSTDSIISSVVREDILQSKYDWKIKHQDNFKLISPKDGVIQQWGDEVPKVGGALKLKLKWFNRTHSKPFDILTDKIPESMDSVYLLDKKILRVEMNKNLDKEIVEQWQQENK